MTLTGFTSGVSIIPYDLTVSPHYDFAPLSVSQDCIDHHCNDDWIAQFSPPVNGLTW
ncbi:MAG: hypothetical protein R3F49_05655 [Planctomycetota bacterium]